MNMVAKEVTYIFSFLWEKEATLARS
jgi:hypothetical protein